MLSDDVRLSPKASAKKLVIVFHPGKIDLEVTTDFDTPEHRQTVTLNCVDKQASIELALVLLSWISRSSRKPDEDFPVEPKAKKKRKVKAS
jgi:hypothetical protein